MKQFRFIGGEDSIYWGVFEPNQFYDEDFKEPSFPAVIELAETSPKDWEEVTEQEANRIPNQDKFASGMTKFEMAVFMVLQGMVANSDFMTDYEAKSSNAINQVQETFKQLDELK